MEHIDPDHQTARPLLLPHVTLNGDGLCLGDEPVCELNEEQMAVCLMSDGRNSRAQIHARYPDVELPPAALEYFVALPDGKGLPSPAESDRATFLVLSPQAHVGFMSLGGSMAKWANGRVIHLTCFAGADANRLPEAFKSSVELAAIQRDEAEICAVLCGCETEHLGYPSLTVGDSSPERQRLIARALKAHLFQRLNDLRPQRVFAPAGLGESPDHDAVHRITLDFFKQNHFPEVEFFLYEDFPSCLDYSEIDGFLSRVDNRFVRLEDHFEDVTGQMDLKDELFAVFKSLWDMESRSTVRHVLRRNVTAARAEEGSCVQGFERCFRICDFSADD